MTLRPLLPALLLALAAAAEPAPPRTILFGTDCDANRPAAARELLAECGFNAVRLTGGGYAWAIKDHAAWARTLAAKGIRSYLQLGSHYPSADYFPLKGAWLVDQAGRSGVEDRTSWAIRYDHSCWPQLSYAHQDFRERLERDFAAYLASFPPAASLAGVILHNEPGFHWLKDRVFDYGAPSVAAFRAWLPGRHGDIATLNRRWGSAFAGFASVEPPTRPDPVRPGAWLDWRRFQVEQIAEFMAWEAAFARRVRPDLARTTNLDGPLGNWYAIRCSDPEAHSRAMDVAGMDIYPTRWSGRAFVPFAIDQLLGVAAGRPAHVLECEVFGDRSEDWKEVPAARRADLLRAQLWTFYGHGADAVLLWGFSRCDAFTISDGEWNPRTLACRDVAHQLRMLDLGRFRRPPPAVALVADPDAHLLASALVPGALTGGSALDRELQGTHAALASAGIPCDVIQAAQLPAAAGRYRALVLPAMPLIDDATADLLRRFAAGGGTVLASAPFAARDRWGAPLAGSPACGLTRPAGEALGAAHLAGQAAGLPAALAADLAAAGVLPALRLER
ncbi:MAG: beta-galactosidase, partial [Planctomycetes bacterium]|nr:beta-galactosidase [Planctomycetota bacterium]